MSIQLIVAALAVTVGITGPACARVAQPVAPDPQIRPSLLPSARAGQRVNLNTASQKELETLPLIGPTPAKAIIAARSEAKFKDWSDFVARKAVSKVHEDAIKDRVSF